MHITKAIGPSGQIGAGLLGNVGRMIVQNQSDHRLGGVMSVQILEQGNKLAAAVAPLDTRRYMTILQIQSRQDGSRAHPLILIIPADLRMFARHRRQVRRRIGNRLHPRFLIDRNREYKLAFGRAHPLRRFHAQLPIHQ